MYIKLKNFCRSLLEQLGFIKQDSQSLSRIPHTQRFKVALVASVSLFIVATISESFVVGKGHIVLLASMGASAVLLFGLPNSPLAKPWSFVGGHLISACIGLVCANTFDSLPIMAAFTIALVLLAMYMFECMHPPGGATALVPVIAHEQGLGIDFLLVPVGLNVLLMLCIAILLGRIVAGRNVFVKSPKNFDPIHLHNDASPLNRLGLKHEDLLNALNQYETVVDISETDLENIYQRAKLNAYQRDMGNIKCVDIMSKDLITVDAETSLSHAWRLLKKHKIRTLPVVNKKSEIIGVISITDFLKDLTFPSYWGLVQHVFQLGLAGKKKQSWFNAKKKTVSQIMVTKVKVIHEDDHIIELIPKLSELGLHQLPVLNSEQRLVGMVTQSDLIAALFANSTKY